MSLSRPQKSERDNGGTGNQSIAELPITAGTAARIGRYIAGLNVSSADKEDLWQEARIAILKAHRRATHDCQSFYYQSAIGAIRHYMRDKMYTVRLPGHIHDKGLARKYAKFICPIEEDILGGDNQMENSLLEKVCYEGQMNEISELLPRLTRCQRDVMTRTLSGETMKAIAKKRKTVVACGYALRSEAVRKIKQWVEVK